MKDGRVSVVVPIYNRPVSSIHSIESALDQTYGNIEVIAVDDASDDETWKRINALEDDQLITIRHETNRGGNAARNTGIKHASGEFLAFLDSDDTWHSEKIQRQLDFYQQTDYDAVYCDVKGTVESSLRTAKNTIENRIKSILDLTESKPSGGSELIPLVLGMQFPLGGSSTLFVNHEFLASIGHWDEDLRRHQDWELLVRILKQGTIGYLDEVLVEKYDTGTPGYELYHREKEKFLRKHAEDVVLAELDGFSITDEHHFGLVKHALRNGEWRLALNHLMISDIRHPGRILRLFEPLIHGRLNDL